MWPSAAPIAQEMRTQIPKPEDLTFNPGTQATISPDGKWLAFPALGPDNVSRMYLRSIDSLEVRPLQGSEGIIGLSPPPFWSYDSRYVVYGAQGKLLKSEVTGTPAQSIAETGLPFVQGGTWNREGTIVYARNVGNLMQISSAGGTPAPLTVLAPGETAHRWPQFLPDGKRFLYLRVSSSPDKTGIYVGSLDAKPEAQDLHPLVLTNRQAWWVAPPSGPNLLLVQREASLLAQPFDAASLKLSGTAIPIATDVGSYPIATAGMWSVAHDGTLLYRSTGQNNPRMFWRDAGGKVIGEPIESNSYATPAVSPDGGRVAFRLTDAQGNQDIWVRDLTRGNNPRLTFHPGRDTDPVWSPDGKKIAFAGQRDGRLDLYEKNADGSGEERLLLKSDQDKTPTSWSRDGKFILFESNDPKTSTDIWVLPLDGSKVESLKPFVFLKTEFSEQMAEFSPDGRWVAYTSAQSGSAQVYVRPFSGEAAPATAVSGAQWMISTKSGLYPRWSGDGKKLFFVNLNSEMLSVDVQPGPTFQAGAPVRMFGDVPPSPYGSTLAGDKFLFVAVAPTTGPVPPFTVVLNWTSRLRPAN
jgi:eukaryotic-like serine/threonine-protein kinase